MTDFKPTAHAVEKNLRHDLSHDGENWYRFECGAVERVAQYGRCQSHIDFVQRGKTGYTFAPCVEAIQNGTCPALKMRQAEKKAGYALFVMPLPEDFGPKMKVPIMDPATGERTESDKPLVQNFPITKDEIEQQLRESGRIVPAKGGVPPSNNGRGLYSEVMDRPVVKGKPSRSKNETKTKPTPAPQKKTEVKPDQGEEFGSGNDMAEAVTKVAKRERESAAEAPAESSQKPAERPKQSGATKSARKTQTPPSEPRSSKKGMSMLERARQMRQQQ